jgi:hypothetical protein
MFLCITSVTAMFGAGGSHTLKRMRTDASQQKDEDRLIADATPVKDNITDPEGKLDTENPDLTLIGDGAADGSDAHPNLKDKSSLGTVAPPPEASKEDSPETMAEAVQYRFGFSDKEMAALGLGVVGLTAGGYTAFHNLREVFHDLEHATEAGVDAVDMETTRGVTMALGMLLISMFIILLVVALHLNENKILSKTAIGLGVAALAGTGLIGGGFCEFVCAATSGTDVTDGIRDVNTPAAALAMWIIGGTLLLFVLLLTVFLASGGKFEKGRIVAGISPLKVLAGVFHSAGAGFLIGGSIMMADRVREQTLDMELGDASGIGWGWLGFMWLLLAGGVFWMLLLTKGRHNKFTAAGWAAISAVGVISTLSVTLGAYFLSIPGDAADTAAGAGPVGYVFFGLAGALLLMWIVARTLFAYGKKFICMGQENFLMKN